MPNPVSAAMFRLISGMLAATILFPASAGAATVGTDVVIIQTVPNAPTSLSGVFFTGQVGLSWTDNATNETAFQVERKTGASGTYFQIATTSANIAAYTDTAVAPNITYFYRVRAVNEEGASAYSNEAGGTVPASSAGGGGGGGGGGGVAPVYSTKAIFRGIAYPRSDVTLLKDAQIVATTKAGPDAKFEIEVENLSPGTYLFGVWAEDVQGNRSIVHTFTISATGGATTIVSGIFIPPFMYPDKAEVKQGDPITFLGTSAPGAQISILVNSEEEHLATTTANEDGTWVRKFDSSVLELGDHTARARAAKDGDITSFSRTRNFKVGTRNVAAELPVKCPRGDLNKDCRVNLVDFSIMAYWYRRPLTDPGRTADLNGDGQISLVDFSILAFNWTG